MRLSARRVVTLLAFASLLAAFTAAPARAADPGKDVRRAMFGLGGWSFPTSAETAFVSRRGLRSWRTTLAWSDVERVRGSYGWSGFDNLVSQLAARRMTLIFTLSGCPEWACHRNGYGPPRTAEALSAWHAFVAAAVRRYGAGGAFWRTHPWVPYRPVRHWQVLNEVNGHDQWPGPSPAGYAALLRSTAAAIRRADPTSKVVLGGLAEKMTIWLGPYLAGLYRQPGFASSFDVMAVEGYSPEPRHVARILRTTRRLMRRAGDSRKPVWITEMSWATGGGRHAFITSRRGQARKLRLAFDMLLACRRRWNLKRVYWFAHRDPRVGRGVPDYWGYHNGLLTAGGRPKPAMRVFLRYVRKRLPRGHRTSCRRAARATARRR
jgi:polysaccharide biosynthesis protein PslG